jgi:hypothetical protein
MAALGLPKGWPLIDLPRFITFHQIVYAPSSCIFSRWVIMRLSSKQSVPAAREPSAMPRYLLPEARQSQQESVIAYALSSCGTHPVELVYDRHHALHFYAWLRADRNGPWVALDLEASL